MSKSLLKFETLNWRPDFYKMYKKTSNKIVFYFDVFSTEDGIDWNSLYFLMKNESEALESNRLTVSNLKFFYRIENHLFRQDLETLKII